MKKIYFLFGFVLLIGVLTACSNSLSTTAARKDAALIQVVNNSESQIASIQLILYQNEEVKSSQTSMKADGSIMPKGDFFRYESLNEIDFNQPVRIDAIVVIDNQEILAGTVDSFLLIQGKAYHFEIVLDPLSNVKFQILDQ